MTERDPWEIDMDEMDKMRNENRGVTTGVICPKRNMCIGDNCAACNYIQEQIYSKQYPEKHPASEFAKQKKAKASVYMNVVFPENPDKSVILKLGSKVGSAIYDGVKQKGWKDIANPLAGRGREMMITKFRDAKYNAYSASPDLNKADWDIPQSVLDNLPSLNQDSLIKMIVSGELTDDNYFDISKLKMDETLHFRICPPQKDSKRFLNYVWRHWGLSRTQIDGSEPISWESTIPDYEGTPEFKKEETVDSIPQGNQFEKASESEIGKPPGCFGQKGYYDDTDEECTKKCTYFKACGREIMKELSNS